MFFDLTPHPHSLHPRRGSTPVAMRAAISVDRSARDIVITNNGNVNGSSSLADIDTGGLRTCRLVVVVVVCIRVHSVNFPRSFPDVRIASIIELVVVHRAVFFFSSPAQQEVKARPIGKRAVSLAIDYRERNTADYRLIIVS